MLRHRVEKALSKGTGYVNDIEERVRTIPRSML